MIFPSRPATDKELLLAHDERYLDVMKRIDTVMHETAGSVRASPRSQKALSDQAVKMQLIEQVCNASRKWLSIYEITF